MMKRIALLAISAFILVAGYSTAYAETAAEAPAGQFIVDDQTVRDLVDLAKKYEATGKLPRSAVVERKPCSRGEAATCLLAVIRKVLDKSQKEGKEAIAQEDLE